MGVGFEANRRRAPGEAEAWRRAIGTKAIPARLAVLPEGKSRWDRIGVSAGAQIVALLMLLAIPLLYPDQMKTALEYTNIEIRTPLTMVPVAPPPPPPPKIKPKAPPVQPKPEPEPVKLNPKQQHVFLTPKALIQPKVQKTEAKAPDMRQVFETAKLETTQAGPKKPKEDVKLNNLNSGSAAPATLKAPVEKVQTGGFGDPNGLPARGDSRRAANINALGSPALPGGPGYGNGTGGDRGLRGTVQSTGFGNGTAVPPTGGGKKGPVQASGFGDQTAAAEAPKKKAASSESPTTPVDILDKPRPQYTAEGRSLKLEGDVVLELVFLANGTVQINRVVSGLGHGLDEAAMKAAQQIKFKPAKREGQPVDFPARVRIEFRLAY